MVVGREKKRLHSLLCVAVDREKLRRSRKVADGGIIFKPKFESTIYFPTKTFISIYRTSPSSTWGFGCEFLRRRNDRGRLSLSEWSEEEKPSVLNLLLGGFCAGVFVAKKVSRESTEAMDSGLLLEGSVGVRLSAPSDVEERLFFQLQARGERGKSSFKSSRAPEILLKKPVLTLRTEGSRLS